MIADLQPYPAYKDSGVPWLGEVPAHWSMQCRDERLSRKNDPNAGMQETTCFP